MLPAQHHLLKKIAHSRFNLSIFRFENAYRYVIIFCTLQTMQIITLQHLEHNKQQRIGIYFEKDDTLNKLLRPIAGLRWSKTFGCWHLPLHRDNYYQLTKILQGKATVNSKPLLQHFKQDASITIPRSSPLIIKTSPAPRPGIVHAINKQVLPALQQHLQLKAYSPSTIKTYMNEVQQFLQLIKGNKADAFTTQRLKDYLQYCYTALKLSENTLHSRINALKFYFEQVLKKEKLFWEIPRPKKPLILPKLLNEEELRKLFNALTNKKHKAMLFTAYSAGLRVSEIIHLKISHIDSKRMQIFIERAKGKKDRYVNLSPVLLDILRKYIKEYAPPPKEYLFESEQTYKAYPIRTVQQIFNNAKQKAGIKKEVGVHSLRHSFATHLLDKGTDIRYIKDLLGHFDIRTTERYLHVSKQKLVNIISPLDDLMNKENIEW